MQERYSQGLVITPPSLRQQLYQKNVTAENRETFLDQCIAQAKVALAEQFTLIANFARSSIQTDINKDLADFGVHFDHWFSEQSLYTKHCSGSNLIDQVLDQLRQAGHTYAQQGALWFRASAFGDTEDRVLVRENGLHTYFAADIAYHQHKLSRHYDQVINIWGADHHGYIPRIKAALRALGHADATLEIILVQFAILYRGPERVSMSTRTGEFVTLRDLRQEAGHDATRLFYLLRRPEQHMDFDLELAQSRTKDNPVYYLQYAHARIKSLFIRAAQQYGLRYAPSLALQHTDQLQHEQEKMLLLLLDRYRDTITKAAEKRDPLLLINYLRQLAADFHAYYNTVRILPEPTITTREAAAQGDSNNAVFHARLLLCDALAHVLRHGLDILGIHAPDRMAQGETTHDHNVSAAPA